MREPTPEEQAVIDASGECRPPRGCGHLHVVHDGGYDDACLVPGCGCLYGMTPEESRRQDARVELQRAKYKRKYDNEHGPGAYERYQKEHCHTTATTLLVTHSSDTK